jgi:hypothetical protein
MEHSFYKKHAEEDIDIAGWYEDVLVAAATVKRQA